MQANTIRSARPVEQPPAFNFLPPFIPTMQSSYLPANSAFIELPEARAEDLT